MAGELTKALDKQQMPAHLRRFQSQHDDLSGGANGGFPILSYKGKVWHVSEGGERTLVETEDGEPKTSIDLIIVKANPFLSKVYYDKAYEEGDDSKPICYSADGVVPAADAADKQAAKCALCPMNQWGSRITDNGSRGKACADSRRMVVIPAGDMRQAPMLLRVPAASLKVLTAYSNVLKKRDAPYQAVITRIGFDHNVAHPQFTFKAVGWADEEQGDRVAELLDDPIVEQILGASHTGGEAAPASAAANEMDELPERPAPAKAKPAAKAKARVTETTEDEVEEIVASATKAAPAAEPDEDEPAPAKAKAVPKSKTVVIDDDGEGLEGELKSLLEGLDDDDE